jgi:hypothetical protein
MYTICKRCKFFAIKKSPKGENFFDYSDFTSGSIFFLERGFGSVEYRSSCMSGFFAFDRDRGFRIGFVIKTDTGALSFGPSGFASLDVSGTGCLRRKIDQTTKR